LRALPLNATTFMSGSPRWNRRGDSAESGAVSPRASARAIAREQERLNCQLRPLAARAGVSARVA
jgi:hypothetical protein